MPNLSSLCLSDLDADETQALHAYKAAKTDPATGTSLCFDLNAALRNGLWATELTGELKRTADALDRVFARAPRLESNLTVYRGVGTRLHMPVDQIGARFRSLEYWSTSAREISAESFLKPVFKPAHGAVLALTLPAGFPVYDMETLLGAGGGETEILLPRSIVWTVKSADLIPEGAISKLVFDWFANILRVELEAAQWSPPAA